MHLDQMFGGLVTLADAYGMGLTLHIFSEDINILAIWRESVCVCYWPPVLGVCPNYEVVEFQPRKATPTKPRLRRLLLRTYS